MSEDLKGSPLVDMIAGKADLRVGQTSHHHIGLIWNREDRIDQILHENADKFEPQIESLVLEKDTSLQPSGVCIRQYQNGEKW